MRNVYFFILLIPLVLFSQNQIDIAIESFENKNFNKAETQFKTIIHKNPNNLKAYEYLGDVYAAQQQWDKAIDAFEYLVNKKPDNADYNFKYGGTMGLKAKNSNKFTALLMLDDVKKYLKRAASLDSNHVEVRWALLELYLELPAVIGGSLDKSKNYALQLQNISPVDGALALGRIADYEEDFKAAEKHYKKAVIIGGSKTCYNKLIDLYIKSSQYDKALTTTKEALNNLNHSDFQFRFAQVALKANSSIEEAISSIDKYIDQYKSSAYSIDEALILKAELHHQLGQIDEAKYCLKQALVHNPDSRQAKTELERIEQL